MHDTLVLRDANAGFGVESGRYAAYKCLPRFRPHSGFLIEVGLEFLRSVTAATVYSHVQPRIDERCQW